VATHTNLAIVISHPTQYYSPWFRWLHKNTALKIRVFYLWEFGVQPTRDEQFRTTFMWDVDLLSGYDFEFVPNTSAEAGTHHFTGLRNPLLTARLCAWRPSAILLFGYKSLTQLSLVAWARLHRVPLIFRGDSHLLGRMRPAAHARAALRLLYRQFAAITFVGASNADYFAQLGVPTRKLFFAPHAVDDSFFSSGRPEVRTAATALRGQLGISPGTRVILFAGKFAAAKQPRELLEAFMSLKTSGAALVFVGDGEEKDALMETAQRAEAGTVFFLPFANQSEMPSRYLMADILVLPSKGFYETWGLAVNEAMHLGLPALVSDRVGCQRDLVTDGETGWVFRADDTAHLRDQLDAALRADLSPIKLRVAARIAGYTYAKAAHGLLQAVDYALS
jgi:glycosyltransferase involved in cell wall biosynthesis